MLAFAMAAGATAALPYAWWRYGVAVLPVLAALAAVAVAVLARRRLFALPGWSQASIAIGAGLLARAVMLVMIAPSEPANDALSYRMLSEGLIAGNGLEAWGMRAHYPPLYPVLLAGTSRLTGSITYAPALLNLATDAASATLVYCIGRLALTRPRAWLAAAIFFLWPTFVAASPVAQKESLTVLLALAAMWLALRLIEGGRTASWGCAFGVVWGLLALTQPGLAPFPVMLLVSGWLSAKMTRGRLILVTAISVGAAILTLLPWWIRNWLVFGAFVPLTAAGGLALSGLVDQHVLAVTHRLSELEYARASADQAGAWIIAHPLRYLGMAVANFARAMLLDIAGVQQYFWFAPPPPRSLSIAVMTFCQLCWIGLWITVGRGLSAMAPRSQPGPLPWLVGAVAMQLLLFNGWLQFHERHRYLLTPLLILIAVRALGHPDKPVAERSDQ